MGAETPMTASDANGGSCGIHNQRRSRRSKTRSWLCVILGMLLVVLPLGPAVAVGPGAAGKVYVQTVPALSGVQLNLDGVPVTTGPGGSASVELPSINHIAQRVSLADPKVDGHTTVAISRVSPAPHTIPHVSRLMVGLQVSTAVSVTVDPGNSGIATSDVESLRLHSVAGQVKELRLSDGGDVTLLSRRAMLQQGVLRTQDVTWSVDQVTTRSGAAVTTASPRFDPYTNARWTVRLAPVAGTVIIDTVPKTRGVMVSVAGATVTTGAGGRGTASVTDLNSVATSVKLVTPNADSSRVELLNVAKLPPPAPYHRRLLVALRVSKPVVFRFVDPEGHRIPEARVDEIRLNQGGRSFTIGKQELNGPILIPAEVARQAHDEWRARRLAYSVKAVSVDGANAVFAGRQRFDPSENGLWRVRLSVYDLTMTVRDSLFGRRTSSAVQVTLPDGRERKLNVSTAAPVTVRSLARGMYQVEVGAAILGAEHTVLVSQNSSADLRVITLPDAVVVLCVLLLVLILLIMLGRRLAGRPPDESEGEFT